LKLIRNTPVTILRGKPPQYAWAAQPGGVGGSMSPSLLGPAQRGTGGGPMKMIFASTADSFYSVLYK